MSTLHTDHKFDVFQILSSFVDDVIAKCLNEDGLADIMFTDGQGNVSKSYISAELSNLIHLHAQLGGDRISRTCKACHETRQNSPV